MTVSLKLQAVRMSGQCYLLTLLVADPQREIEMLVDLTKQGLNLTLTNEYKRFGGLFDVPDVIPGEISK